MKQLLATSEALALLPGEGSGLFRLMIAARWVKPCNPAAKRAYYRSADIIAALDRIGNGETPQANHSWKVSFAGDCAHLIPDGGTKPCCTSRDREWMTAPEGVRRCSTCMGAAKGLRVEES